MEKILNYINGELVEPISGNFLDNVNPSTGKTYSLVPDSDEQDALKAIAAAKADLQNDIGCYADFAMLIGTQAEIIIGHNNRDGVPQALVKTVIE